MARRILNITDIAHIDNTYRDKLVDELNEMWMTVVGSDHHKDRDCHWSINQRFSYGERKGFTVEHYGYIYEDVSDTFPTWEEARAGLIGHMVEGLRGQFELAQEDGFETDPGKARLREIEPQFQDLLKRYKLTFPEDSPALKF